MLAQGWPHTADIRSPLETDHRRVKQIIAGCQTAFEDVRRQPRLAVPSWETQGSNVNSLGQGSLEKAFLKWPQHRLQSSSGKAAPTTPERRNGFKWEPVKHLFVLFKIFLRVPLRILPCEFSIAIPDEPSICMRYGSFLFRKTCRHFILPLMSKRTINPVTPPVGGHGYPARVGGHVSWPLRSWASPPVQAQEHLLAASASPCLSPAHPWSWPLGPEGERQRFDRPGWAR